MDPDPSYISRILIVLFLIIAHGFFSSGEILVVSKNKRKIYQNSEDHSRNTKKLTQMVSEPSKAIASMEAGMIFTEFLAASAGLVFFYPLLRDYLMSFSISYAQVIAFAAVIFVLAFFMVVFGVYIPKRIALHYSESFAAVAAYPLLIFIKLMKPFVLVTQKITLVLSNILGISGTKMEERITMEEIRTIIDVGQEQGVINNLEKEMIDSVINFDNKYAEDIMTARTEVFMIDVESPIEEYVGEMLELKYSRIPVYEGDIDNIIGLLYVKDYLLHAYQYGFTKVNLRKLIRPAYFIPERKGIDELFLELQETRKHMAILIDEYGGFSGIVTMEDILEEIVGDIDDEYDHDEPDIRIIDSKNFYARGSVSIKEINSKLGTDFDENSDDFDTLGGLLITEMGYIPEEEEHKTIEIMNARFFIHRIEDKRIMTVRIELLEDEESEEKESLEDID
ncbi:MAG: hemolysin family protein [Gallicola sp.]|nr:hemolysin family protein [Gallicola sp.]